jgi:hypothetical protein
MNTALQNHRRHSRQASRARAYADRNYRQVGYLDALLLASGRGPYRLGSEADTEWRAGYEQGQAEQRERLGV